MRRRTKTQTRLVLLCGLPASGKTTLARVARHSAGGLAITESHMETYRDRFQPPTIAELSLYDPPTARGAAGAEGMPSRGALDAASMARETA